jgi:hypothetical protein
MLTFRHAVKSRNLSPIFAQSKVIFGKMRQPNDVVVPLGADCHPTFFLEKLGLKQYSLTFDRLGNLPTKALDYVYENWNEQFRHFNKNLTIDEH